MTSSSVQNPPAQNESKASKKKKSKVERTESPAPAAATPEKASSVAAGDQDDLFESTYIREYQKNIRNISKKITNLSRVSDLVAEHPGKTLDELVALKIINADQKASQLKKPALQAQLFQLEEQLAQHRKIEQEHRARIAEHEKALTDKFEKEKAELVAEIKEKAEAEASAALKTNLLILSQFLRLAAARRAEDIDSTADENMALEGVLLHIYSGDENAVATMLKLVNGADEQTHSTVGDLLQTTYAQVKQASIAHAAPLFPAEVVAQPTELEAEAADPIETKDEPEADPTVVNAGLTEIDEGSATVLTNGHTSEPSAADSAPSNADVTDSAANAAGESQWDTGNDMTMSQEWVDVKVPAESGEVEQTEPQPTATPVAPAANPSWADDHPEATEAPAAAADPNDGFHQVQRNRGNREGAPRGRGDRGGHRGRGGYRGEGRGRGRGGQRGERGGNPSRPRRGGEEH
ncbi:hypothetical protein B0H67DRAFT_360149 [Lasiosphaeris hirsuta]|uniref:YAG7-like dimerisation domain-containing protein n=1 Tax=Lasiosphaeris hirsuta TaxID=260670 RepID=A0AA39ZW64_9PEZI|nr:hypothetical protein B0H67DRAFT_360149 [Lasiosphaeris hirsuta]